MKILNKTWFNDIGMITIDTGYEIKTYIGKYYLDDEERNTNDIIKFGYPVYPNQLQRILDIYKENKE